ncbi:MAG: beta-propeller domain-containing protein [Halioglobus sp.]
MNKCQQQLAIAVVALFTTTLMACGGGGGGGSASDLQDTQQSRSLGLLKPADSATQISENLKKGLSVSSGQLSVGGPPLAVEQFAGNEDGGTNGLATDFSTTNVQVEGVDEADLVKYDGNTLFVLDFGLSNAGLSPSTGISQTSEQSVIRLFDTDTGAASAASATQIAQIEIDTQEQVISGLYLAEPADQKLLLGIGQTLGQVPWELFALDYYWREGSTQITAWDVASPASPTTAWSFEVEGSLLTSRRIDDTLYVVTRFTPSVSGVVPYTNDPLQLDSNRELIEAASIDDLLPRATLDEQPSQNLVEATDCLIPNADYEGLAVPPAGGSLVTVTAIDLADPANRQSICLNTFASGFYSSTNALYLTAHGADDTTLIHKVSLNDGNPEYRGSGAVPGYIGTTNPAYLMSERAGDLRVISSSWRNRAFPLPVMDVASDSSDVAQPDDFGIHRLTVLRESATTVELEVVSSLPNASRPQHIGKPLEDIYAARFLGDRAYAVTFRVIDPLYVLDLADAEDPRIAGELELPGFSSVLQPLGDSLLLGVGTDVPDDGAGIPGGVKVGLFDISNLAAPVELGNVVIGERASRSPAQFSYYSLSTLERDGVYRVAFPVDRHTTVREGDDAASDPSYWYDWTDSGLFRFEVNPGTGSLNMLSPIITEQRSGEQVWPAYNSYTTRSVLQGDSVFISQESRLLAEQWGF